MTRLLDEKGLLAGMRPGFPELMASLAKSGLIVLDDWGPAKRNAERLLDLLDLLDERHGKRSTLVSNQLPVWVFVPTSQAVVLRGIRTHAAIRIS